MSPWWVRALGTRLATGGVGLRSVIPEDGTGSRAVRARAVTRVEHCAICTNVSIRLTVAQSWTILLRYGPARRATPARRAASPGPRRGCRTRRGWPPGGDPGYGRRGA